MAKKDLDGIELVLLILFLPFVIGYFLLVGIVKLIKKANENTENYTRNGSGRRDFIAEDTDQQRKEARRLNRLHKKNEKEKRKLNKVATLGNLGRSLDLINQEFQFLEITHKEVVECMTTVEYTNFNPKSYFSTRFTEISELVAQLHDNVDQNCDIYYAYKKKFFACKDFTPEKEIKQIPKRRMSVKKFQELEKKLFADKIKTPPNSKIAFQLTVKYQKYKKIIDIDEAEIKRLLQEIKEERDYNFVCSNSVVYKELCELNGKYNFHDIKIQDFNIKCNSYNEYQKFDIRQYARKCLTLKTDELENLYNQVIENEESYNAYKKQYLALSRYLKSEEEISAIKNLPLSIIKFQMLENKLYSQAMLKEPVLDFCIYYTIEYTSPAGRNHYKQEETLTKEDIGSILSEIEKEKIARQATEKQRDIAKQQRAQEQAEIRALLKNKDRLARKEAELAQREQEFQRATRGHIYATSDYPAPIEFVQQKTKTSEESLSAWEKMKQLKKAYENGEITYEEYNEKRKHLL